VWRRLSRAVATGVDVGIVGVVDRLVGTAPGGVDGVRLLLVGSGNVGVMGRGHRDQSWIVDIP
jgi:hypothetical protein